MYETSKRHILNTNQWGYCPVPLLLVIYLYQNVFIIRRYLGKVIQHKTTAQENHDVLVFTETECNVAHQTSKSLDKTS